MNELVVAGPHHVLPRASQSKSVFRKYLDVLTGGRTTDIVRYAEREAGIGHVAAAFDSFTHVSMGVGAGGLFGFLAKHDMIEVDGHPVDAWAAGSAAVIGVFLAKYAVGQTVRTFAGNAASIWAFRQVSEWKASVKSVSAHGEDFPDEFQGEEDPIVAAARDL